MSAPRVLVADDDPEFLAHAVRVVSRLGYEVRTATSGGELLEMIAEQEPFSLIITDISMPWMTGLQVMHSVRTAGLDCPVIVMTALHNHGTTFQVAALGDDVQLLHKPFSSVDLDVAIHRALELRADDR